MKFENLITNPYNLSNNLSYSQKDISLYPVGEYNLDGIIVLIENCRRNAADNSNVEFATVSPSLWLGGFLEKHWDKISYVCALPNFRTLKVVGDGIVETNYKVDSADFNSEQELDNFFENNKWRRLVLFYIIKVVDLRTMSIQYRVRYGDITEKFEERDNKINSVLGTK